MKREACDVTRCARPWFDPLPCGLLASGGLWPRGEEIVGAVVTPGTLRSRCADCKNKLWKGMTRSPRTHGLWHKIRLGRILGWFSRTKPRPQHPPGLRVP